MWAAAFIETPSRSREHQDFYLILQFLRAMLLYMRQCFSPTDQLHGLTVASSLKCLWGVLHCTLVECNDRLVALIFVFPVLCLHRQVFKLLREGVREILGKLLQLFGIVCERSKAEMLCCSEKICGILPMTVFEFLLGQSDQRLHIISLFRLKHSLKYVYAAKVFVGTAKILRAVMFRVMVLRGLLCSFLRRHGWNPFFRLGEKHERARSRASTAPSCSGLQSRSGLEPFRAHETPSKIALP